MTTKQERAGPDRFFNSRRMAFSPDGKTLVSEYFASIVFWQIETGECSHLRRRYIMSDAEICTGIFAMALSPDNKTVAIASSLENDFRRDGRSGPISEVLLADIAAAKRGLYGDDDAR